MYPNGYGNGSPAGPSYSSTAIPAPIPKASYAPPVFQTFQDRKRAKEAALRASIEPAPPLYAPPPNVPSQPQPPMTFGAPHSASIPSLQPNSSRPLPLPRGPPVPTEQTPSSSHSRTQSPVEATLERSDTLASIRSLDRSGFSTTRRPLPKPPTKVNSSRSLDRGILDKGIQGGMSRRKPSDIPEEEERSPAKFSPLPAISIEVPQISFGNGDPVADITVDSPSPPSPGPGIVVSNIPSISVTTDAPSPVRLDTDAAIICAGCGNSIIGKILNAMKKRFHPQCFACSECGENLEHVSSYEWEGKAYCHLDYHDKFAHHCHHCKTPIVDPRFVTLQDETLGQRYYHELHFFCSECGDPFLDPSKAGGSTEDETNAFTIHKGHPYCERCHLRLHKPKCKACKAPIADVAVNAMGSKWHKQCFVCDSCSTPLNHLFFPRDGKAFCTACWESI